MQPQIGIPIPTSDDHVYNRSNWASYADAIQSAGGKPVAIPLGLCQRERRILLDASDGFILPGSLHDVDPALYGHARDAASASADVLREQTDREILELADSSAKPILGICFGLQMLNVFYGGTLVQDLTVLPVNHSAGRAVTTAHSAAIEPNSTLAELLDQDEIERLDVEVRLPVNSSHHQAIGLSGAGLRVVARCPQDGVVEAVEFAREPGKPFILGVQWHPERTTETSSTSRALFTRLVSEARVRRPARA